ncbi:hypothetical protein [Rhodanobacter sp. L36]|uniref:hypothetical protein n=1 Tax=Rhodanobacter sp. L36 TaxID=1747221 RepID=UPI0020B1627E|nr:hypothetical protein [Rhodanobacter sp. L36]
MKTIFLNRAAVIALTLSASALTGCGTPAAKDFGGSWKPVNRFQTETTEIPLERPYTYFASPLDGTLKTMLTRWSKDTGMTLSYQLHSDFTLYTPVTHIHTSDVNEAAAQLSSIFAQEGVSITVENQRIVVGQASAITPDSATSKGATGSPKAAAPASSK